MYRMQYFFETLDKSLLEEMVDAARKTARLAEQKGIRPATIWVSHDEKPKRLVLEFTGKDQWEANAHQQAGKDDPDLAPMLESVFKRRLTSVEVYEEIHL